METTLQIRTNILAVKRKYVWRVKQTEALLSVCSLQHSISLCSEKLHSKAFWWSFSLSTQRDAEWNSSGNSPPKSLTLSPTYSLTLRYSCVMLFWLSLSCSQVCRIEWPLSQVFALDLLLPATGYFVLIVAVVVVVLCNATCSSWEWMKVLCCAHNISSHIFVFCRHFILPTHTHTHSQRVSFLLCFYHFELLCLLCLGFVVLLLIFAFFLPFLLNSAFIVWFLSTLLSFHLFSFRFSLSLSSLPFAPLLLLF